MSLVQDVLELAYRQRLVRRYRIVAPRKRASYFAALTCTYSVKKPQHTKSLPRIRARLNRVRVAWLHRLWDLSRYELWLFRRGLSADPNEINPDKLIEAFKLFADCRPRCVVYMPAPEWLKSLVYKPCYRSNFCPHCWASVAARQMQRAKRVINTYIGRNAKAELNVTTQISEQFFTSCGIGGDHFTTVEDRYEAIMALRAQMERYKTHLEKLHKRVQRNTVGAMWRMVIIPAEAGWRIQLRQFFLTAADKKPPTDIIYGAKLVSRTTTLARGGCSWKDRKSTLTMDSDIYDRLMEFNTYPMEWLTEDIELTAIYLNAAAKHRLIGGTGKLSKVGTALVREFVFLEAAIKNAKS